MDTPIHPKLKRAFELRCELFDIANSLAGEKTGDAAVLLHKAANHILYANNVLNGLPARDSYDVRSEKMNDGALAMLEGRMGW